MEPSARDIWQLRRQFKDWVQQNVEQGIDGLGKIAYYIPSFKLETFWTPDRIATILGPYNKDVDIGKILNHFIQVTSILTYIEDDSHAWTRYLERFYKNDIDDHSLPLNTTNLSVNLPPVPPPFGDDHDSRQAWSCFSDHQWKFLPLHFKPNDAVIDRVHPLRVLDPRHVIPITVEDELSRRSGRGVRVLKVKPHKASGLPPESIVLKEYDKGRYQSEFQNERHTYTAIRNLNHRSVTGVSEHFLHYHGCFIQGNKCVLLIEYSNQGTLLNFFENNWYLPRTKEEAQNLWRDLGQLIKGLALLHNGGKHISAIHQDIKPANIFVFKPDPDQYRFHFKLGDFGLCSVTPTAENGNTTGDDNGGTMTYSAPELSCVDLGIHMDERVSWQADIWSFGCVLLECGVWMTMHERGRIDFQNERAKEIDRLRQGLLKNAGYAMAFHDGEKVLSSIKNKTEEIQRVESLVAQLVGSMMNFIQKEMLRTDVVERLTAQQLQARFQDAIDGPLNSSSPSMHSMPISPPITSIDPTSDMVTPGIPQKSATWVQEPWDANDGATTLVSVQPGELTRGSTISYREASQPSASSPNPPRASGVWQSSIKSSASFSKQPGIPVLRQPSLIGSGSGVAEALTPDLARDQNNGLCDNVKSVLQWIPKHKARQEHMLGWLEQCRKQLSGRDQCFIFDNSESMGPHWKDVKDTANALTYILKAVDPDGLEIHMASSRKPLKCKDRGGLFDKWGYFDQNRPRKDLETCPMETVLSDILESAMEKALAPTSRIGRLISREIRGISVYVFTNGIWESPPRGDGSYEEAGGVENAIKTAVNRLQKANKMRTFLSIQFISFGNDREGLRRMRWLDDDIKAKTGGWDIVDTTHHTGSVKKMIIGAISEAMDGHPDDKQIAIPGA
ncbi:kinase-like domain-containing protein [Xylaria digitata]|nr:kinase-like domain-containing protein [Xylaria digitata]